MIMSCNRYKQKSNTAYVAHTLHQAEVSECLSVRHADMPRTPLNGQDAF